MKEVEDKETDRDRMPSGKWKDWTRRITKREKCETAIKAKGRSGNHITRDRQVVRGTGEKSKLTQYEKKKKKRGQTGRTRKRKVETERERREGKGRVEQEKEKRDILKHAIRRERMVKTNIKRRERKKES